MSYYNWEYIFESKDTNELIKIFKGNSLLDYEAEFYAAFELRKRNIHIDNYKEYISIKVDKLKHNIEEQKNFRFVNSKYYKSLIFNGIAVVVFVLILIGNKGDLSGEDNYALIDILFYLMLTIVGGLSGFINYYLYKRDLKKAITRKTELLDRLLEPLL